MKKTFVLLVFTLLFSRPVFAELQTQNIKYKDGGTVLEGYLAYDDSFHGKRPGILVVHEWNGLGAYVKSRAEQLAQIGYVAFAPDIYGKGVRPSTFEACQAESTKYKKDRKLLRERVNAGLEELKKNEKVDPDKIAAIGYCFGGTAVMELGRSGANVAGLVSFHGGLDNPAPADDKNIKSRVLVLQGGADQFTLPQVPGFKKEMKAAKVKYRLISYPGAVHGFTNPDNKGAVPGMKYNAKADRESWKAMMKFFSEIFK